jgi:ADP-heptose:LPS heptosyltransferase
VRSADAFLGVDSCMLHAADLFRVPSVGLFGPTRPSEFGLRFARHRIADGRGSMAALTPDVAAASLDELLAEVA